MLIFLQNLKILIRGKLRYKFFRFQFYMITVAILEVTSVSLIAPMVGIATSPDEFLRKGVNIYQGDLVYEQVATDLELPFTPLNPEKYL